MGCSSRQPHSLLYALSTFLAFRGPPFATEVVLGKGDLFLGGSRSNSSTEFWGRLVWDEPVT